MIYPRKFQVTQDSYFDSRRAILKDITLFNIFTSQIVLNKIIMTKTLRDTVVYYLS